MKEKSRTPGSWLHEQVPLIDVRKERTHIPVWRENDKQISGYVKFDKFYIIKHDRWMPVSWGAMYSTKMDFPTIISNNDKSGCEKKWGVFRGFRTRRTKKNFRNQGMPTLK